MEENGVGDKYLAAGRLLLSEHFAQDLRLVLFHLKVLNSVGLIRCSFGDYENALSALSTAESFYLQWKLTCNQDPDFRTLTLKDAFCTDSQDTASQLCDHQGQKQDEVRKEVEKAFTQTVYYLAQVLEKRGESGPAAKYCTQTLVRQYESADYDPMDWSLNAATLSQYYACHNNFVTARQLLAAAQVQLDKIQQEGDELLDKRRADLHRIFVKYCMMLMDNEEQQENPEHDSDPISLLSTADPDVDRVASEIAVIRADSYESAVRIFQVANKRLEAAISFFTLNEHASDHADCILDQSRLYQLLIQFQTDAAKVCKLHKRRVDLLQKLLSDLNPVYFMAHVRRIRFELGETYSEMVHQKSIEVCKARDQQVIRSAAVKINSLISKSILNFESFVHSLQDKKTGKLPDRLEEEDVRPVLVAWFTMGRLHTKRVTPYEKDQLQMWTDCESCYEQVVAYVDKNPDQEPLVEKEVKVIREMLPLIPEKKKLILGSIVH